LTQDAILKPGINDVSNADYHKDRVYLSSSNLKTILTDLAKFHKEKILGIYEKQEHKTYFDEGSLTHAMILEPDKVSRDFAFFPGWTKAGGLYEQFVLDNPKKTIISVPQKARCDQYVEAFRRNKTAVNLIRNGLAEHTVCVDILGVPIKIRTDYINVDEGYIVDVKTSSMPVDVDSFRYIVGKYQYDLSAALYLMVAEEFYGKPFDFYFPAIAKKDSVCEVFKLSQASRTKGELQVSKAIQIYKKCKETGIWESNAIVKKELTVGDYEILEV